MCYIKRLVGRRSYLESIHSRGPTFKRIFHYPNSQEEAYCGRLRHMTAYVISYQRGRNITHVALKVNACR